MPELFLYGTLLHAPLLAEVAGTRPEMRPAVLHDHAAYWAADDDYPLVRAEPGARLEGAVISVDATAHARIDYYEGGFGYETCASDVETAEGTVRALVYFPPADGTEPGAPWSVSDWAADWGEVSVHAAREMMAHFGQRAAHDVADRYVAILSRVGSKLRARAPAPATLRRAPAPGDVECDALREPYANYFSVEEADLRFRRFDGAMSRTVTRASFIATDAVTVLPYDPRRDRVMVIEQFRPGPWSRGDSNPWSLEPIAGRVDGGEGPETAARREAAEEAGLALRRLVPIGDYYPSPGAVTEFLYSFVALADLPDSAAGLGGVAAETEDIRAHVIPFAQLMDLLASGEARNGPLILSALWLARQRSALRDA